MSNRSSASKSERQERTGASAATKVIEIGPSGEAILQQVEQLDRLINASASTASLHDSGGGTHRKGSVLQRRPSLLQRRPSLLQRQSSGIVSLRSIFDAPKSSPSPTPDDLIGADLRSFAGADMLDIVARGGGGGGGGNSGSSRTHSIKSSRGRKVHPHIDTAAPASSTSAEPAPAALEQPSSDAPNVPTLRADEPDVNPAAPSGQRRSSLASVADIHSGSGRRNSVASVAEGSLERRRKSVSVFAESMAESVVDMARTLTKVFDKSSTGDVEEKRQAKVAELLDKEVMVLNAAQLAQIQQRNANPFTISINSPFRRWWDFVVTLSLVYAMFAVPIKVGFSVTTAGVGFAVDAIVDVIFLLDTTLNFFTSYEDDATGEEIQDIVKIRHNYLYGWFVADAVSSFPASLVGTQYAVANLAKLVKMAQVSKISNSGLFKAMSMRVNRSMNPSMLRMVMLTLVFVVSQHFIACTYFFISTHQDEHTSWGPPDETRESPLGQQYIYAFYFAIMVTTANDVNPTTYIEKLFTALMLFVGIVINASIIGSAANLLSNLDKAEIARKNQMDTINEYMRFKKVPLVLQEKIRRYYDYALNGRIRDPTDNIFVDLPDRLKLALKLNLHEDFIRKVPLFRVCSNAGVVAIIQCLKVVVAMPGEIIVRQGEVAHEFYFIKSGRVSIGVQSDNFEIIPLGNLGEGSFFGEISLLTGEAQIAEVRAESIAELAYLTQSDFSAITDKFPTFLLAVKRISESRQQTATNVRKMTKHIRHQPTVVIRKNSFRSSAMSMARRGSRAFTSDSARGQRIGTAKRISNRLSNSRRKAHTSFNATYVEQLSLAQARQLSQIRAIHEVVVDNPDEDISWD